MGAEIQASEPLTVSVEEARRLTGLGETTIYKLIGARELDSRKVGTRRLVVYSSIKKYLGLSVQP